MSLHMVDLEYGDPATRHQHFWKMFAENGQQERVGDFDEWCGT